MYCIMPYLFDIPDERGAEREVHWNQFLITGMWRCKQEKSDQWLVS